MTDEAWIWLNPKKIIGEVHDHLYGANLEHIGQGIYGGVWAEMLRDRKFAGNDLMYTGTSEGLQNVHPNAGIVVPWEAVNPNYKTVRFVHDNTIFYSGQQSQRISIQRKDGQLHGIKQGGLYLEADHHYDLRIVLKGEGQTVTIQLGDETWELKAESAGWHSYYHQVKPHRTLPKGEFSVSISEATLWVGCVSLMPSNNIKGFRADLIESLKDWSPTHLRWPGGNFVSAYHWELAIGDHDKRPSYLDPAWWQWESNDMGIDEFIDLCRMIGSEPVLTINMGNGTVDEAVAWLEYCNGDASTAYGALRIENGHTEPHQIKVWFVGNEQFGNWQVGHIDAETYARRYLDYAKAMRAIDDDLTLIGVGVPTDLYGHWNEMVLNIAAHEMDEYSIHYYSIRTEKWASPPSPEHLYLPKIAASYEVAQMLDDSATIIDQFSSKSLPIAFDEWNTYYGAKSPDFIEDYNLADAIYTGALMNACIQRAHRIKFSAIYHLVNAMGCYLASPLYEWQGINLGRGGGWVAVSIGDDPDAPSVVKMPTTLVLELMTKHRGKYAIECQVESPSFSSPSAGNLPAYEAVPSIDAAATYDETSQKIYLSIVNRSVESTIQIHLDGISAVNDIAIYTVTGDSPLASNSFDQPENVAIQTQKIKLDQLLIPPHSYVMAIIQLS